MTRKVIRLSILGQQFNYSDLKMVYDNYLLPFGPFAVSFAVYFSGVVSVSNASGPPVVNFASGPPVVNYASGPAVVNYF